MVDHKAEIDADVAEILAGLNPTINPSSLDVSHRAHDIVTAALRLEGARAVGYYESLNVDKLKKAIADLRKELDIMETWANLEKPK